MKRTILMALVLVLAGCQKEARATLAETYFPLNVGNSWTYQGFMPDPIFGYPIEAEFTFTIIGTEEVYGHTYYVFDDYFNIFPPPPDGEWKVTRGIETLFRYDPDPLADRVLMRKSPYKEIIRYNFIGDEWQTGDATGWCRLKQTDVTCSVPAGEFSDCINFQFSWDYGGPPDAYAHGEYLAPGVGNIKFVRPGGDLNGVIEGQWVTFELVSYTIVPEPGTILLLGLGGLLLGKRR